MSRHISQQIRDFVLQRAGHKCEYCCLPEGQSFYKFQIDHIISIKHGGETQLNNLALACAVCNRNKGSDLGTFPDGDNDNLVRFYNPRKDQWKDHFLLLDSGIIQPISLIGEATDKILGFNHPHSVMERKFLLLSGLL